VKRARAARQAAVPTADGPLLRCAIEIHRYFFSKL